MYHDGCPECKTLKTALRGAQEQLKGAKLPLKFATVECDTHDALCARFKVTADGGEAGTGTPYLAWFRAGNEQKAIGDDNKSAYDGARSADGVVAWAKVRGGARWGAGGVAGQLAHVCPSVRRRSTRRASCRPTRRATREAAQRRGLSPAAACCE